MKGRHDDDAREREWREAPATVPSSSQFVAAIESAAAELPDTDKTPPVERADLRMTPAAFASAVDLADRDAYARGWTHGITRGKADAEADFITEITGYQEDVIDCFRQLFLMFEIPFPIGELADWATAERWVRSRMRSRTR